MKSLAVKLLTPCIAGMCCVVGPISASAETPAIVAAPVAPAPNQVGVVAAVQNRVSIGKPGAVGHVAQSGQPVFLGEVVTTDASGRLQIMLLDETIFTIGPNSAITIDEFVYDPSTDAGKVSAEILRGAFRFVTGKIAHKDPTRMKVKLPAGTIGVRGTLVVGHIEGQRSTIALVGPGSIVVDNPGAQAGRAVTISRPGFGTVIDSMNAPPTPPAFVPPQQMNQMNEALGPLTLGPPPGSPPDAQMQRGAPTGDQTAENRGTPAPQGSYQPGQPGGEPRPGMMPPHGSMPSPGMMPERGMMPPPGTMPPGMMPERGMMPPPGIIPPPGIAPSPVTMPPLGIAPSPGMLRPPSDIGLVPAPLFVPTPPVQATTTPAAQSAILQTTQITNLITTLDQLRSIQTGVFHFRASAPNAFHQTAPVDKFGPMAVSLDVNFGSRTIGGGTSKVRVQNGLTGTPQIDATLPVAAQSWPTGGGPAVFTVSGTPLSATFTIQNGGGVVATEMKADATYDNGAGKQGTGVIDHIARQPGAGP